MGFDHIKELLDLIGLGVLAVRLDDQRAVKVGAAIDMVTAGDPLQAKTERLERALKIAEAEIAAACRRRRKSLAGLTMSNHSVWIRRIR